jgi:hypothetical protein
MMAEEAQFREAIEEMIVLREQRGIVLNGKKYLMVKDRVEAFRRKWGAAYGIDTLVDYHEGLGAGCPVVATAKIMNTTNGIIVASGHAVEFVGSNQVNDVSAIEAAETSAIGRALAAFGLSGGEFASANEIEGVDRKRQAVASQPASETGTVHGPQQPAGNERGFENPSSSRPAPAIPQERFPLYVPRQPFDRLDIEHEVSRVADEVALIKTVADLTRYWSEIKPFRDYVDRTAPALGAEIKLVFSNINKQLSSMERH